MNRRSFFGAMAGFVAAFRFRPETPSPWIALKGALGRTEPMTFVIDGVFSEGDLEQTVQQRIMPIVAKVIRENERRSLLTP